jgi:MFS transporter, PPP family, 3-phenylpropionic acid transporter
MRKISAFTYYFMFYAALACMAPFLVLYYQQLGFTGAQIGLLAGVSPLIRLVSGPLWTGMADATRRHRFTLSLTLAGAMVLALVFPILRTFGAVALLLAVYSVFTAPLGALADSATMSMLAGEKGLYGRLRLGGTIGWGLAAPVAGALVQAYGLRASFWSYAVLMLLALVVSQGFAFGQPARGVSILGGVGALMAKPRWVLFLALAFMGGLGFASVGFLFPYMQEVKASATMMGLALTISTLSELPALFYADRLLRRLGAHGMLVLSIIILGVRLLLYAALNFPVGVLVFQILNGLTTPIMLVAGVSYADENAPAGMGATAQGLFSVVAFGFGMAVGGFFSGLLLGSIGGRGMYLVAGLVVLVGSAIITFIEGRLPAEQRT